MTFARLRAADWVAMVAALALLFIMAADWYSTSVGDRAREIERSTQGNLPGEAGQDIEDYNQQARSLAEGQERNAWQPKAAIDRVLLVVLLATLVLTLAAGFLRAAGRQFEAPLTPSGLAAIAAGLAALIVAYRLVQEPGDDVVTTVKAGAPLALVALGVLAFASSRGLRHEEQGKPFRDLPQPPPPPEPVAE